MWFSTNHEFATRQDEKGGYGIPALGANPTVWGGGAKPPKPSPVLASARTLIIFEWVLFCTQCQLFYSIQKQWYTRQLRIIAVIYGPHDESLFVVLFCSASGVLSQISLHLNNTSKQLSKRNTLYILGKMLITFYDLVRHKPIFFFTKSTYLCKYFIMR